MKKEHDTKRVKHTRWRAEVPGMLKSFLTTNWWKILPESVRVLSVIMLLCGIVLAIFAYAAYTLTDPTIGGKLAMLAVLVGAIVSFCSFGAIIAMSRQFRDQIVMVKQLTEANVSLTEANKRLTETNAYMVERVGEELELYELDAKGDFTKVDEISETPFLDGGMPPAFSEQYADRVQLPSVAKQPEVELPEVKQSETKQPEVEPSFTAETPEVNVVTGDTQEFNIVRSYLGVGIPNVTPIEVGMVATDPTTEIPTEQVKDAVSGSNTGEAIPAQAIVPNVPAAEVAETPDEQPESALEQQENNIGASTALDMDDVMAQAKELGIDGMLLFTILTANDCRSYSDLPVNARRQIAKYRLESA